MKNHKMGTNELFAEIGDPGSEDTFQVRLQHSCCHGMQRQHTLGASCSKMLLSGPGKHTCMAGHNQRGRRSTAWQPATFRPCTLHTRHLQQRMAGQAMGPSAQQGSTSCCKQQQLPPKQSP